VRLFGLDISSEMLKSARAALGGGARLGEGDACAFDPAGLLGEPAFDRIVLSYALSMIPDWEGALEQAAGCLAPGGQLHVVDFGDGHGLPVVMQLLLRRWLAMFHVEQRAGLPEAVAHIAAARGLALTTQTGPLGYYQIHVLSAPRVP
jgi:S-adenosylmethionine-diacylgycerolhomoserine-N-methlytransferase